MTTNATAHRPDACEFCGTIAKPKPFAGKRRYPHKCSHGMWCERGTLNGAHANHPTCPDCLMMDGTEYSQRASTQQVRADRAAAFDARMSKAIW